jgi:hypothetical protein
VSCFVLSCLVLSLLPFLSTRTKGYRTVVCLTDACPADDTKHLGGYELGSVAFDPHTGDPVEEATSSESYKTILESSEHEGCPNAHNCLRPVGLAWDKKGRLWMSSDTTGEIFVLMRTEPGMSGKFVAPTWEAQEEIYNSVAGRAWAKETGVLGWVAAAVVSLLVLAF